MAMNAPHSIASREKGLMARLVMKFGGTSVADIPRIRNVAAHVKREVDAGHDVTLASIAGGAAPIDPASLDEPWLTEAGRRFQADRDASARLAATPALAEVSANGFDAVYFVGGAGAAWDFPVDADVRRDAEAIDRAGGVVSGVCHGVLGVTSAETAAGQPLVAGRKVTAVSNEEEALTTFDTASVVPENRHRRDIRPIERAADERRRRLQHRGLIRRHVCLFRRPRFVPNRLVERVEAAEKSGLCLHRIHLHSFDMSLIF